MYLHRRVLWPSIFLIFIVWMNWRTLQPTIFLVGVLKSRIRIRATVSHVLGSRALERGTVTTELPLLGLHSCLYFSPLEKLFLKKLLDTSSIPSRHLAICRASQAFSYRNPDSFSISGGSIKKAPASSIASRHLVDRSSFYSWIWWVVPRYLLDTLAVNKHFLNTYLDSFLDTSRYLICQALLKVLFKPPRAIRSSFHSISLSITLCFLSQTLSSHSNLNPQRFL